MIAQLFANIFFFINSSLMNTLVDSGPEMGVFKFTTATRLKASIQLLSGWASRVGFKDLTTNLMISFSAAVNLLATPPRELLKVLIAISHQWLALALIFP